MAAMIIAAFFISAHVAGGQFGIVCRGRVVASRVLTEESTSGNLTAYLSCVYLIGQSSIRFDRVEEFYQGKLLSGERELGAEQCRNAFKTEVPPGRKTSRAAANYFINNIWRARLMAVVMRRW